MGEPFRAFVMSDIHLGNRLAHSTAGADGVTDRIADQLDALEWCFDQADELDLPLVCLGDLFDDHLVDTITLELVADALAHRTPRRGFYVIPGNHDAHDQTNRHFSPTALGRLTSGLRVLNDLTGTTDGNGVDLPGRSLVSALPFCSPPAARRFFADHAGKDKLLLGHLEVDGFGHGGSWLCTNGLAEEDLVAWGAVLSGHFHAQQQFKRTQGMYVGALTQLKFDDVRKSQGGWSVSWDGRGLEMEFVAYSEAPTFGVFELKAVDLERLMDESDLHGADPFHVQTFTKFVVSGTDQELAAVPWEKVREAALSTGARKVVFEHRPVAGVEVRRMQLDVNSTPLEDLVAAYVEHPAVDTKGLDKDVLLDLGLRMLGQALEMRKQLPVVTVDAGGEV
jgi:DNA repair exonuclease SbcCD nuclease subunit